MCPHAGGVGLCELVQHISCIDIILTGTKEGKWTAWFSDGRLTEGFYANGKKDATWASWWDHERTRKEMQGAYRNGKMVDKWFFYDKNGNLKEIRYFSPAF